jgi:hypothetical protein
MNSTRNPTMSRFTSLLLALLLPILALGLSACATDRPVQEKEQTSDGPTVYGKINVSLDHETIR